jgi:FdrA protein
MIDPTLRNQMIGEALRDGKTAIILLDVVLGYGANADPAGELIAQLPAAQNRKALLIASVCGTEEDPQGYSRQAQALSDAGIVVAPSNAHAAEFAIAVHGQISS